MVSAKIIKNYKPLEAFVQFDYLDGFEYIDKAGELVNQFVRKNKKIPEFNMGLQGLKISDVSEHVSELKISSTAVWIHFVEPRNLGNIAEESIKILDSVAQVIKPTMYRRVGWRTYFAREGLKNQADPASNLKVSKVVNDFDFDSIVMTQKVDNYNVRLEVSSLENPTKSNKSAILFDVDFGVKDEETHALVAKDIISDIHERLRSESFIGSLEELIS
jgi:hypothetical protein